MRWFIPVIAALNLGLAGTVLAAEWGEGWDPVDPPAPTDHPNAVEVTEFFWYGCPHCYDLEPHVDDWLKTLPEGVVFQHLPATMNPGWVPHAYFYYAAKQLGVLERLHKPLFDALHRDKQRLYDKESLIAFAAGHGVDAAQFRAAWDSFGVFTQVQKARKFTSRHGLDGVPAFGVNGKYKTGVGLAGGRDRMFKVLDELIATERASSR